MQSTTRSLWIFVIFALVAMCLCAAAVTALAAGVFTFAPLERGWFSGRVQERLEQTFEVGRAPSLEIDNFAGEVKVRTGEGGAIRVIATKKAPGQGGLASIDVEMTERDGGLVIRTRKPVSLSNASVDLDVTVPADSQVRIHTGAGTVGVTGAAGPVTVSSGAGTIELRDVKGDIDAHTGAGTVDVRGAVGKVRLNTGAGTITYEGTPQGDCRFETGAGRIELRLPADLHARVDLGTGVGAVRVEHDVVGQMTTRSVRGTIGRGDEATIYAHCGTGEVTVKRR